MSIDVQHRRDLSLKIYRLIKQCGNPETGKCLIPQLPNTVSRAGLQRIPPGSCGLPFNPFVRHPAKNNLVENPATQPVTFILPRLHGFGRRKRRDTGLDELSYLAMEFFRIQEFFIQPCFKHGPFIKIGCRSRNLHSHPALYSHLNQYDSFHFEMSEHRVIESTSNG